MRDHEIIDVAIIGGGAAGVYAAYRLALASKFRRLELFERNQRIGGRLWSMSHQHAPGHVLELGGAAFSRLHANVHGLCRTLGLEVETYDPHAGFQRQYQRNQRFWSSAYTDEPSRIPYTLPVSFRGKDPFHICTEILIEAIPGFGERYAELMEKSPEGDVSLFFQRHKEMVAFLHRAATRDGIPIRQRGYQQVIMNAIGAEGFHMIASHCYCSSYCGNYNLANLLIVRSFVEAAYILGEPFVHIKAGYDRLPKRMAEIFRQRGGAVHPGTQLTGITMAGDVFCLDLMDRPSGACFQRKARRVILALPKRAIELLSPHGFLFGGDLRQTLAYLSAISVSKTMMIFEKPWWTKPETAEVLKGCSTTDLPLHNVGYVGVAENGRGILNASMADGQAAEFWQAFSPSGGYREPSPPPGLAEEMVKQLETLHGSPVPAPLDVLHADWTAAGGGWHQWNINADTQKLIPKIRKPFADRELFLCGEAFSLYSGWVEGALNTAERVVQMLGLPRASWLDDTYDLGP